MLAVVFTTRLSMGLGGRLTGVEPAAVVAAAERAARRLRPVLGGSP
jgi:hypothetical protein